MVALLAECEFHPPPPESKTCYCDFGFATCEFEIEWFDDLFVFGACVVYNTHRVPVSMLGRAIMQFCLQENVMCNAGTSCNSRSSMNFEPRFRRSQVFFFFFLVSCVAGSLMNNAFLVIF